MGKAHARHLIKRSYSDPLWSLKRGEVVAYEKVTLYGLTLVERGALSYASIDHVLCRDLFIREGLVNGAIQQPPSFLITTSNWWLGWSEAKGRRRDLLVNEDVIYQFYAQRLPEHICRIADLKHWLRRTSSRLLMACGLANVVVED